MSDRQKKQTGTVRCPGCGTSNRIPKAARGYPRCARCREALPWVVTSSAAEFPDVVLGSRLPVLVDFFADWCGPCHLMSPVLEQVARELAGRIKVAKVDVDANAGLASQYGIQSIPTIVLIRDGREAGRLVGAHPAGALRSWLEDELEASSRTLQGETQPGE